MIAPIAALRLAAGLCRECDTPRVDRSFCAAHRDAHNARRRKLWRERRELGLCGRCGEPSVDGARLCERHAAEAQARLDAGLCCACNAPRVTKNHCAKHAGRTGRPRGGSKSRPKIVITSTLVYVEEP